MFQHWTQCWRWLAILVLNAVQGTQYPLGTLRRLSCAAHNLMQVAARCSYDGCSVCRHMFRLHLYLMQSPDSFSPSEVNEARWICATRETIHLCRFYWAFERIQVACRQLWNIGRQLMGLTLLFVWRSEYLGKNTRKIVFIEGQCYVFGCVSCFGNMTNRWYNPFFSTHHGIFSLQTALCSLQVAFPREFLQLLLRHRHARQLTLFFLSVKRRSITLNSAENTFLTKILLTNFCVERIRWNFLPFGCFSIFMGFMFIFTLFLWLHDLYFAHEQVMVLVSMWSFIQNKLLCCFRLCENMLHCCQRATFNVNVARF